MRSPTWTKTLPSIRRCILLTALAATTISQPALATEVDAFVPGCPVSPGVRIVVLIDDMRRSEAISALPSIEDHRLLGVRNHNQYAVGALTGCEAAALLQALQYKGILVDWDLPKFLSTIPSSPNGNPEYGFVGSPYEDLEGVYNAIYPAPLAAWGSEYGEGIDISGSPVDALLAEVKAGNPVVVWVTEGFGALRWWGWSFGTAPINNHAVTLDGYDIPTGQVHVSDSISGTYWLSRELFESVYDVRQYAVVVR